MIIINRGFLIAFKNNLQLPARNNKLHLAHVELGD